MSSIWLKLETNISESYSFFNSSSIAIIIIYLTSVTNTKYTRINLHNNNIETIKWHCKIMYKFCCRRIWIMKGLFWKARKTLSKTAVWVKGHESSVDRCHEEACDSLK